MRECDSRRGTGSESGGGDAETKTQSEAKAERRESRTDEESGKAIGINCHVLQERSLYRFEGLKAKDGPRYT